MTEYRLQTPLADEDICRLRSADKVLLNGTILTGRDAAHKRLVDLLDRGGELPVDVRGQVIYFVGPTPARPGRPVGSAGPTTSCRMDAYSPRLIAEGLKGMIGKGPRSQEVKDALIKHHGVYFAATGGAGALLSTHILRSDIIAYDDLGPEAIRRMTVQNFPVIVVNDILGNDLYEQGKHDYEETT
jgi:fumarate hydratase subunit beta